MNLADYVNDLEVCALAPDRGKESPVAEIGRVAKG
jgi:hypothetical protein